MQNDIQRLKALVGELAVLDLEFLRKNRDKIWREQTGRACCDFFEDTMDVLNTAIESHLLDQTSPSTIHNLIAVLKKIRDLYSLLNKKKQSKATSSQQRFMEQVDHVNAYLKRYGVYGIVKLTSSAKRPRRNVSSIRS